MMFAAGLLNAGGPSKMPISTGQALAQGLMAGQQGATEAAQNARRNQFMDAQISDFQAQAEQRRALAAEIQRKAQQQAQLMRMLQEQYPNDPRLALAAQMAPDEYAKSLFAQPKQATETELAKLTREMNALPPGSPLLPYYKDYITKLTTHSPPVQVTTYGSPVPGIGPDGKPQLFQFPNKPGAGPTPTGISPMPSASTTRQQELPASLSTKLIELDESSNALAMSKQALDEALKYNDKAYSGYFAGQRAMARSNLPGESESANATVQYENIINTNALGSLKTLFGGQPTEGERKVLLDLQASSNKTPAQRKEIIDRAKKLADERASQNASIAEGIRSGRYSTKQGAGTQSQPLEDPLGIRR
jgi:hypothetical protein